MLPRFPDQGQFSASGLTSWMLVATLGAVLSGLLVKWKTLSLLALIPAGILITMVGWVFLDNLARRLMWYFSFTDHPWLFRLKPLMQKYPDRFRLFVFHYGRIGLWPIAPIHVIRDELKKIDSPVWPAFFSPKHICAKLGVPVADISTQDEYRRRRTSSSH